MKRIKFFFLQPGRNSFETLLRLIENEKVELLMAASQDGPVREDAAKEEAVREAAVDLVKGLH